MRRLACSLLLSSVLAIASVSSASAEPFNLALLGLGSNVMPVYLETDAYGPTLAIVSVPGALYLVNPRRGPILGQTGIFCFEPVPNMGDFYAPSLFADRMHVVASTVMVNGKMKVQLVDLDGTDGRAPWVLVEPAFRLCK